MDSYLEVSEREGGTAVSFPLEDGGTLSASTLEKCFPESCGLRFRSSVSKTVRGLRCVEGKFYPPEDGWEKCVHFCGGVTKYSKRKVTDSASEDDGVASSKAMRFDTNTTDLIVLGLNKDTTEEHIRECFEEFGELHLVTIKREPAGVSKGFGFIRFAAYESQKTVLENDSHIYLVNGRRCEVKIPLSKIRNKITRQETTCNQSKIFVGRFSAEITPLDLRQYFSQFGEVAHVYVPPKQVKPYAFVTFKDHSVVQRLWGEHHTIKGNILNIQPADERLDPQTQPRKGNKRNEQKPSYIQNARLTNEIVSQIQHILASQNAAQIGGLRQPLGPSLDTSITPKKLTLKSLVQIIQTHTQLLPLLVQCAAKVAQDLNVSLANNQVLKLPSGLNQELSVPVDPHHVQQGPMLSHDQLMDQSPGCCSSFSRSGASIDYAKARTQRGGAFGGTSNGDFTWRPFYNSVRE